MSQFFSQVESVRLVIHFYQALSYTSHFPLSFLCLSILVLRILFSLTCPGPGRQISTATCTAIQKFSMSFFVFCFTLFPVQITSIARLAYLPSLRSLVHRARRSSCRLSRFVLQPCLLSSQSLRTANRRQTSLSCCASLANKHLQATGTGHRSQQLVAKLKQNHHDSCAENTEKCKSLTHIKLGVDTETA